MWHKQDHQKLCVNNLGTLDNGPSVAEDKPEFPTSFLHGIPCPRARGRQATGQLRPGSTVSPPQGLGHQGKWCIKGNGQTFSRGFSASPACSAYSLEGIGRHICVGFPRACQIWESYFPCHMSYSTSIHVRNTGEKPPHLLQVRGDGGAVWDLTFQSHSLAPPDVMSRKQHPHHRRMC